MLAASEQLQAIDTSTLPAPFDQLGGAFEAFAGGFGNGGIEAGEGSTRADIAFIAAPLVELARNLDNIVDGIDEQVPDEVPVIAGLTKVLSTVTLGLANTLEQLVLLDTSATGEQLIGTVAATRVRWLRRCCSTRSPERKTCVPAMFLAALLVVVRGINSWMSVC